MHVPQDLKELLEDIASDFPTLLRDNLVGIYVWGSLSHGAFDAACSDVDCVAVTRRELDSRQFSDLDAWFTKKAEQNRWTHRIDMRFVIEGEFLDKTSRCCGFYPYLGKLTRHASDGNPIIWINIAECGITLWGQDAKQIAPVVSRQCLNDALLLELNYLKDDLTSNAGDRSSKAFIHNAYAVLTACRILYTAQHGSLVSKERAYSWAMETVPPFWRNIIDAARQNRMKNGGSTTPGLEADALRFVEYVTRAVR